MMWLTFKGIGSVVKVFAQCGKNMKALQRFSERVYKEVA